MIGYQDLKHLVSDEGMAELPPIVDQDARRRWWAERGVDYPGLERYCVEDGADTAENTIIEALGGAGFSLAALPVVLAATAAMSVETGFMLGWRACERQGR